MKELIGQTSAAQHQPAVHHISCDGWQHGHMTVTPALWHGGAPGREVGEFLLPPSQTGLTLTNAVQSLRQGLDQIAYRDDLVYVTTDRTLAKCFASAWVRPSDGRVGFGWVYRVAIPPHRPDG